MSGSTVFVKCLQVISKFSGVALVFRLTRKQWLNSYLGFTK